MISIDKDQTCISNFVHIPYRKKPYLGQKMDNSVVYANVIGGLICTLTHHSPSWNRSL